MTTIQRYVSYRIASNTVFYLPVVVLVFRLRLDSIELALALVSVYTLAVALAEIPTGMFADAFGHRTALIGGVIAALVGTALLGVGDSFLVLAAAQVFSALAFSLRSGTESVYLYDLMTDPTHYQRFEGRTSAANYLALGISSVAGGALYALHPIAPFALTFLASVVALALLLTLPHASEQASARRPSPTEVLRKAGVSLFRNREVLTLIAFFAFLLTATALVYWAYQLYLDHLGVPTGLFGVLFALGFLASAVGSWTADGLNRRLGFRTALLLSALLAAGTLLAMGSAAGWWAAGLPLVTQFLTGYLLPTLRYLLQERVSPEARVTLLSLESLLQRGLLTLATLAFGFASASLGLERALLAAGVSTLLLTAPLLPTMLRIRTDTSTA